MSIFRKCHMKLFLIVKVGDPFWVWLHFYRVFEMSPKSVFHYFGLSWTRLEKCIFQSAENFKEHRFIFSDILQFLEPDFQIFQIPGPRKSVFGAWGRFWTVLGCPKIIDLFTVLQILYKFWKMLHKSVSYEPSCQYGISPFLKTIINKSKYL